MAIDRPKISPITIYSPSECPERESSGPEPPLSPSSDLSSPPDIDDNYPTSPVNSEGSLPTVKSPRTEATSVASRKARPNISPSRAANIDSLEPDSVYFTPKVAGLYNQNPVEYYRRERKLLDLYAPRQKHANPVSEPTLNHNGKAEAEGMPRRVRKPRKTIAAWVEVKKLAEPVAVPDNPRLARRAIESEIPEMDIAKGAERKSRASARLAGIHAEDLAWTDGA